MHVPDHFLNDPASVATAAVALGAVGYAAHRARPELTRERVVLAAATTGFVFAVQMLNFPVASGTSGHLMGGALAAALLGPWLGILAVTVVLLVQALVFADGGLTALGTNVVLMAVVGTLMGWAVTRLVERSAGGRLGGRRAWAPASAGALVSVPVSALVFAGLFTVGGTVAVDGGSLFSAMLSVHVLIGLGEAVITGAAVAAVLAVAPGAAVVDDRAVAGAVTPAGSLGAGGAQGAVPRSAGLLARFQGVRPAVAGLTAAALLAAVVLSSFASSSPDGLEATAESVGFAGAARDHALGGLPLADYGDAGGIFVGLAGGVGVLLAGAVTFALLAALIRRRTPGAAAATA